MKRNQPVSTIMTTNPYAVHAGQSLSEVAAAFRERSFHHVPVVDGSKVIGLLSAADVLAVSYTWGQDTRNAEAVLDHTATIQQVMTPDPVSIGSREPIRRAVEILAEGAFHALPVVDDDKLVGIVTSTDLLRYLHDQY